MFIIYKLPKTNLCNEHTQVPASTLHTHTHMHTRHVALPLVQQNIDSWVVIVVILLFLCF